MIIIQSYECPLFSLVGNIVLYILKDYHSPFLFKSMEFSSIHLCLIA